MFPCLIKYNETNSRMVHVPFNMALSIGKYSVKEGATAGPGIKCLFKIKTTIITNMVMAATKRNINLSVIFERLVIKD